MSKQWHGEHELAAMHEASRRGHTRTDSTHILLALLDPQRPSIAGEVLRASGVDEGTVGRHVDRMFGPATTGAPTGSGSSAGWHEISGRAHGFAATLGDGHVTAEHTLLALLWSRDAVIAHILSACGTDRQSVLAGLSVRGVRVPNSDPPTLPEPMTQAAVAPRELLADITRAMYDRAPDLNWGMNTGPDGVIVVAAAGVDLAGILDDVAGPGAWRWDERMAERGTEP